MWKSVTYGPSMVAAVGAENYLEIDLIVPEFAEASTTVQNEPWMETVRASAATDSVALIQLGERSYILLFPQKVAPLRTEPRK
jgi:hypothetical protein